MCFLHHRPDLEEYGEPPDFIAVPRSCPRLTWAVPVDAAELGASLEAFEALSPQIQMLRLCHRFGHAPLSRMPQELLDIVISTLYRSTREVSTMRWKQKSLCFQGRCTTTEHLKIPDDEIEGLFSGVVLNQEEACCSRHRSIDHIDEVSDLTDHSFAEKREMVEKYINGCGDWAYDTVNELHEDARDDWLDMLCLCKVRTLQRADLKTFLPFQQILKSRFGLEAVFLHETLSEKMNCFLPNSNGPSLVGFSTSCFLVLPNTIPTDVVPETRAEGHGNPTFLGYDTHFAFNQKIDLMNLNITEKEKASFARVLSSLEINLSFHLTNLEASLASHNADDALSKINDRRIDGWPQVSSSPVEEKKRKLEMYLERKHKEVGNQQWPQLMLMAASDTVGPIPPVE